MRVAHNGYSLPMHSHLRGFVDYKLDYGVKIIWSLHLDLSATNMKPWTIFQYTYQGRVPQSSLD